MSEMSEQPEPVKEPISKQAAGFFIIGVVMLIAFVVYAFPVILKSRSEAVKEAVAVEKQTANTTVDQCLRKEIFMDCLATISLSKNEVAQTAIIKECDIVAQSMAVREIIHVANDCRAN